MKAFLLTVPGILLGGCTLVEGEPPGPDVEAPAAWSAAPGDEGDADGRFEWWKDRSGRTWTKRWPAIATCGRSRSAW